MKRFIGAMPLRTQLAVTYAGIALLTAALLGGILIGVLGNYYARAETAFLQAAAQRVLEGGLPSGDESALHEWATRSGISAQARVRLYDASGQLLADSGTPANIDPTTLGLGEHPGREGGHRGELPRPLGGGIFGSTPASSSSSGATLRVATPQGGYLVLSDAPVSGRDVLTGVAQAWSLAALLAVVLAALAGYLLSSRMSRPVVELTQASERMADGDLSARASVIRGDEFGHLAEAFNTMAERIEGTVVSLRRFVADAAHEIGTPLTALQADLELAEKAATTDNERRLVLRSLTQARRLEALTQGLLRLSRLEAGENGTEPTRVDVAALAHEAADCIASRAEAAELTLEVAVAPEPLPVDADHAKLQIVLESLLDNAVKFTPAGGTVRLAVSRDGADVVITVADTGVGIPLAEHDEVFERFHRARNVAAYPGSGLGLAIVKATAESFGGSVGFESSEAGTRFEVRLPSAS
jgi:signal transduction histidine kinase